MTALCGDLQPSNSQRFLQRANRSIGYLIAAENRTVGIDFGLSQMQCSLYTSQDVPEALP